MSSIEKGKYVQHPTAPWGIGKVREVEDVKARVLFETGGEKMIDLRAVELIAIAPPVQFELVHSFNRERVRAACDRFYRAMTGNRSNVDDGRLAVKVIADLDKSGALTRQTKKQLAAWCTTHGTAHQEGVDLARAISLALYGRVLTRDELA